jgi:hypothetical protein
MTWNRPRTSAVIAPREHSFHRVVPIEFHLRWFTMGGYDLAPKTPYPEST